MAVLKRFGSILPLEEKRLVNLEQRANPIFYRPLLLHRYLMDFKKSID
jgi:hypothetical protein